MSLPYLTSVRWLAYPGTPSSLSTFLCSSRLVLAVLDADCQSMPKSTPFNNSACRPHKILWDKRQTGSSSALTSDKILSLPQESHMACFLAVFPR